MRALSRGDTGAAMAWALKSQDAKFTTYLADRLLAEYATTGLYPPLYCSTTGLDINFFYHCRSRHPSFLSEVQGSAKFFWRARHKLAFNKVKPKVILNGVKVKIILKVCGYFIFRHRNRIHTSTGTGPLSLNIWKRSPDTWMSTVFNNTSPYFLRSCDK
jgi:hypothetical protein